MLDDYLIAALGRPWRYGNMDCCCFAGDWIFEATGRDPFGPYRDTYENERGAMRLIVERGGLLSMVTAEMARTGFEASAGEADGDVAFVKLSAGQQSLARACLAIRRGPWLIARGPHGLTSIAAAPAMAWAIL